eukprot:CAMPEP_0194274676 /NCGR_PEP_ID=MMETSP0169-20130528/7698_1 /TAXON_ID=218684 /ORGANISM="Corethron pennatum, Strain L29A3" /LENGTH=354 /DNA_ID=CAMNT_0039017937 /DNA_START=274 /DNA_END=1338 /DNA_ORIENTATION=+
MIRKYNFLPEVVNKVPSDGGETHNPRRVIPVSELTRSHIRNVECPEPLVPLYDKIVDPLPDDKQQIPRSIHLAWIRGYHSPQSRCISKDMMEIPRKWMEQFPSYSLYFHDDEAVDMLFEQKSQEFPHLVKIMNACVKFGGAMKIDIWRVLILYTYGGFYSDFDIAPGPQLNESSVQATDSAFFLTDPFNRPSQWLHGIEPQHSISYFTMMEILKNLQELKDVSEVKLVFVTGPHVLLAGYCFSFNFLEGKKDSILTYGLHQTKYGKLVRKLATYNGSNTWKNMNDRVPFPRNSTHMIARKDRIYREMNYIHWRTIAESANEKKDIPRSRCRDILYMNDINQTSQSSNEIPLVGE